MKFNPQLPLDSVIAADILLNSLVAAIGRRNREIASDLIVALAAAVRNAPPQLRGAVPILVEWKQTLETPPSD